MGLRPTHLGYAYQDLLTAIRLVDVMLGLAPTVIVDTKSHKGDRFDDITCEWAVGGRQRIQIKHTSHDARALTTKTFSEDGRSLQLGAIITSAWEDLQQHPETTYRIVLRDVSPEEDELTTVLRRCRPGEDPGPVMHGVASTRMRFDADRLMASAPWQAVLATVADDVVRRVCDVLVVDVGLPACSLDLRAPGPAEQGLLRRVSDELGAGRPPNSNRSPEDVASALIEAAKSARSLQGTVTAQDLIRRLDLTVDFGAVREGHPVDKNTAITRPSAVESVLDALNEVASEGGVVTITGGPGVGKSWLCEQLADQLGDERSIVARHHCWLGAADSDRERRVLTEVAIGSLLRQLEAAAPAAVAGLRPRYAATQETLAAAVKAVRDAVPERRLILIVDGLDHVTRVRGRTQGAAFDTPDDPAALLVEELSAVELPPGTVLVVASQPGAHLASVSGVTVSLPPLERAEVHHLADRLGLLAAIHSDSADEALEDMTDAAIELIHTRSRGNALYATYLCRQALGPSPVLGGDGTSPQDDPLDRLRDVPATADDLDDYYSYLLSGLTDGQQMAVSLLAVCDFAVSTDELRDIFPAIRLSPSALSTIAPIVIQQPGLGGLRIHHESFSRYVRERTDAAGLAQVRGAAVAWLTQRGFFTDIRAFRHLPELLVALDRDTELSSFIEPDFVANAIAGLQPPATITHVLRLIARRAAARLDWPLLVRCVELRRAAYTYETEHISQTLVDYADVIVALRGADAVAASLVYDGMSTVEPRWGLQLCSAVDTAGAAAPWDIYLDRWEQHGHRDNTHYGHERDDDLDLVLQLGYLRLPNRRAPDFDESGENPPTSREQQLADHLGRDNLPPLRRLLDVFIAGLDAPFVLNAARLVVDPRRRAAILLHLADVAAARNLGLPAADDLAMEAWLSSPTTDPLRMLRHGIPADKVVVATAGSNMDAALRELTATVLDEVTSTRPEVLRQWLTLLNLAHATDRQAPLRLFPRLEGPGFYRAWLRFTATTVGLREDVAAGATSSVEASTTVRVALERLAQEADHFTGKPRACDLWSIHSLVHEVFEDALALVIEPDLDDTLRSLIAISDGTTTSLMGMAGSGPLTITDLLTILGRTVDNAGAATVQRLMNRLRNEREAGGATYPEFALFELEMAGICLAAGDREEALKCWKRSARYAACYGSHKDLTLLELLDPLPNLAAADLSSAQARLARIRDVTYLVTQHTDGRETRHFPRQWWELLADLHPEAAAVLAAQHLLDDPGLADIRVDAAQHRLLRNHPLDADPVTLAALRIAGGSSARDLDADVALLGRLNTLPAEDPARAAGVLSVLANAITATYDDQTLLYASGDERGPAPSANLSDAAVQLGGNGVPCYQVTPRFEESSSPPHSSGRHNRRCGFVSDQQRPELRSGTAGVISVVRRYVRQRYDSDDASPRRDRDALTNIVGWKLVETANQKGTDVALRFLNRIAEAFTGLDDSTMLAEVATGLDLRRPGTDDRLDRLASTAYVLAFTRLRGGGGWKTFAGRDRVDLWERAATIDANTAATALANQVVRVLEGKGYATSGIAEAMVAAFAAHSPDPTRPRPETALACWDAAMATIAYRVPGTVNGESEVYDPEAPLATGGEVDVALSRLILATITLPDRADRRRALVATTVLLACRPVPAQTAAAHVLTADLGAGPLTWLLSVLRDGLHGRKLLDVLVQQLSRLARCDLLSVRVLAGEILEAAGHHVPNPPATTAHPTLSNALAKNLTWEQ
ncbi:ATP-binding protein [Amycolatopsis panacis]|uniref:ATP-binding protein n=1 Tax=Amycolatopsis panacis TaxID=2340917 RepID=A0A419IBT5_9PSEU|nr:ATP-binding protein [Amycolatopsis panacis]RJQ92768.1 ATP-binding protein [Amycolatopsis panacis]